MAQVMWRSKLGNEYPKAEIEKTDREYHTYLKKMRNQDSNRSCADCNDSDGAMWAVVNIGSFVCVRCASVHRGVGTHISKVKGCSGTYLWGPDEVGNMIGNAKVREIYGGQSPGPHAGDDAVRSFILQRYGEKKWMNASKYKATQDALAEPGYLDRVMNGSQPPGTSSSGAGGGGPRSGPPGATSTCPAEAANTSRTASTQSATRTSCTNKSSKDLAAELFPDLLDFGAVSTTSGAASTTTSTTPTPTSHPYSTYSNLPADFDPFAAPSQTSGAAKMQQATTVFGNKGPAKARQADIPDDFFDTLFAAN